MLTAYTYDPNSNRATLVDPLGRTTTYGYDALDGLVSINYSDPGTADVTYSYDANGNRASMTDGAGATTYTYDEADRLLSVTSPGPKTIGYRYDLNGNRTRLIYPDATAVNYVFNFADQLGSLTDWAAHSVSYTYWPDGLLKTATSPDGSVATRGYDNSRRLVDIAHRNAAAAILDRFYYTLDAVGNVTSVANGSLQAQFARPDGLAGSNGTWSGTYASIDEATPNDADFLASPSGPTSSHSYEVALSDVEQPYVRTGITVRYRYAKSGNNAGQSINLTVELRQGSTVIASQTHTNIPGVSGSGWQQGTITLTLAQANTITNFADLRIRFRPTGGSGQKRSAQISWAEVQFPSSGDPATQFAYTYDRLYRLTTVTGPDGPRSYTYDPVGNRLTKVAGATTSFTYDRADRMTTAGVTPITVDANGNLTANGVNTFVYDQANRMTSATISGATETYIYDGDGTRFKRQIGANLAFTSFDLLMLVFGPEKDREENSQALLLDAGGFVVPCVAGLGILRRILGSADNLADAIRSTKDSDATLQAFERTFLQHGRDSLLRAQASITRNLEEHIRLVEIYAAEGGRTSSMLHEIDVFKSQLHAIEDILRRNP